MYIIIGAIIISRLLFIIIFLGTSALAGGYSVPSH